MPEKPRSERDWHALLADQMIRHGRLFYRVAFGILREESAAEDACQQALLRALSWSDPIRGESLRPWMVRLIVNKSLAIRRRWKLEKRTLLERSLPPGNPKNGIDSWERREAVLEAVETLVEPTRSIVVMRLLDGMSGVEVALALACSSAYVSRQLHSGMAMLRIALKDWKDPTGS